MFEMSSFCLQASPEALAWSSDPLPRFRHLVVHIWSSLILE